MERRRSTAIVLAASFLCLIFGLGCTVIGIFGEGWWIENLNGGGQIEDGVLRYCKKLEDEKQECGYYPNLFSFTRYEKEGTSKNYFLDNFKMVTRQFPLGYFRGCVFILKVGVWSRTVFMLICLYLGQTPSPLSYDAVLVFTSLLHNIIEYVPPLLILTEP